MTQGSLRVGIAGCGLIGRKRSEALRECDSVVGCFDIAADAASTLARDTGATACTSMPQLLALDPDVIIVATSHDALAALSIKALEAGAHVLVEKPAGLGVRQVEEIARTAERAGRRVKVGFNHRFHPALRRVASEVHSGEHGDFLFLRARYGHGGRPGYDREWRADPMRSGGGELVDQGMHLLDLTHWLAGELPLHSALLRTQFWRAQVDDNAVLVLGDRASTGAPWALLHVSWTEWKNTFSLEVYCRTAKLQVDGLVRSYGTQRLQIFHMQPELGPPDIESIDYPPDDVSWQEEWSHFAEALMSGGPLLGSLDDAAYAWARVEEAYDSTPYAAMRARIGL